MAHDISESEDVKSFDVPDSDLPPLPADGEDSFLQQDFKEGNTQGDGSILMDREMKRQLMDIESSFLPEAPAPVEVAQGQQGADDTYLFGGSPGNVRPPSPSPSSKPQGDADLQRVMANLEEMTKPKKKPKKLQVRSGNTPTKPNAGQPHSLDASEFSDEPPTPADAYKTPAARRLDFGSDDSQDAAASTSEAAPSSPSAEAALRNQSRTATHTSEEDNSVQDSLTEPQASADAEWKEVDHAQRPTSSASTVKAPDFTQLEEGSSLLTSRAQYGNHVHASTIRLSSLTQGEKTTEFSAEPAFEPTVIRVFLYKPIRRIWRWREYGQSWRRLCVADWWRSPSLSST
jgi:hypothetical protein